MPRPSICIVTPALAAANNGNWQTARRWALMLGRNYRVRIQQHWDGQPADALIALHARRSAEDVAAWRAAYPSSGPTTGYPAGHLTAKPPPLVLVLTGTDLYRDIATDALAQKSLQLADRLVVLNEQGPLQLPAALRRKCSVCLQSTPARQTLQKTQAHLRALMVGHLRDEKRPQTYFAAARLLSQGSGILLDHIGSPLDADLGAQAAALQQQQPRYRWLGGLDHARTRRRIQQAHVLVHPSIMEGGAHVVIEAITSGTPVLASRIDGNVGLLGADYPGYFEPDDAAGLATLLQQCRDDGAMLARLAAHCAQRAPLFHPERERQKLRRILSDLLEPTA